MKSLTLENKAMNYELNARLDDYEQVSLTVPSGSLCWLHRP